MGTVAIGTSSVSTENMANIAYFESMVQSAASQPAHFLAQAIAQP
jgi:hypothetical protein